MFSGSNKSNLKTKNQIFLWKYWETPGHDQNDENRKEQSGIFKSLQDSSEESKIKIKKSMKKQAKSGMIKSR
jgi:hypothetical protein